MLQGGYVLRAAEKILYQIIGRHRSAGFEHYAAVAHRGISRQKILMIELKEEILGDHFIPQVGVIRGGIAAEVTE